MMLPLSLAPPRWGLAGFVGVMTTAAFAMSMKMAVDCYDVVGGDVFIYCGRLGGGRVRAKTAVKEWNTTSMMQKAGRNVRRVGCMDMNVNVNVKVKGRRQG